MDKKIGFIGCGNMGEALIKGVSASRIFAKRDIFATDMRLEKLKAIKRKYGVNICRDVKELYSRADIILLCVKPHDI